MRELSSRPRAQIAKPGSSTRVYAEKWSVKSESWIPAFRDLRAAGMTTEDTVRWGRAFLNSKGILSERLDAEVILASVLGIERAELGARPAEELPSEVVANFSGKIDRRSRHEPVAYITGVKEFWSLPFRVGPGVLIPRPETERLVEVVVRLAGKGGVKILDVGTGSGNIAIALAKELPTATITAIDCSEEALSYARENSFLNGVDERIHFVQTDLLTIPDSRFPIHDVIVSNPPYIASAKMNELDPTIKDFEPTLALDG